MCVVILMEVLNGRDGNHHVNAVHSLFGGEATIYKKLDPNFPRPRVKRNGIVIETERCKFLTVYVSLLYRDDKVPRHSDRVLYYETRTDAIAEGSYKDFLADSLGETKKKKSRNKKKKKKKTKKIEGDQNVANINKV